MSTSSHGTAFAAPKLDASGRIPLIGLDMEGMKQALAVHELPAFRAKQVWNWVYQRGVKDFEAMSKLVRAENYKNRVLLSPNLDDHVAQIQHYIDLGFDEVYVHNVNRNQAEFIEAYGKHVIPALKWPKSGL